MDKIKTLEDAVRQHRKNYYNDEPTISDADFDLIEDELRALDPENLVFSEVGAEIKTSHWNKIKLPFESGSLNKAMSIEEFKDWVRRTGYQGEFVVSAKMDGGSSIETWNSGRCDLIATRGDSHVGEDVTSQFPTEGDGPSTGPNGNYRAECVVSKKNFMEKLKPKEYKNARNSACSLMRSPKADREDIKLLERIYYFKQGEFKTEWEMWEKMKSEGLKTAWHTKVESVEGVEGWMKRFEEGERDSYEYEIDGLVVIINNREWHEKLGSHAGRPKFGIAIKFKPKFVETVVMSVTWNLGDSGRFTPVAHVHPVSDSYATIRNINLHNMDFIKTKGVKVGSKVKAARSGDCIPYIYEVLN